MTMMFLLVILGATDKRAPQGFAPIIGAVLGGIVYRFLGSNGE
jgi:aquaporin Z